MLRISQESSFRNLCLYNSTCCNKYPSYICLGLYRQLESMIRCFFIHRCAVYSRTIIFYPPLTSDILCLPHVHTTLHGLLSSRHTYNQVNSRLLLDAVVPKGTLILKLRVDKDQALVFRKNTLPVLDLDLQLPDSGGGVDLVTRSNG
jgi:hypothetical protein